MSESQKVDGRTEVEQKLNINADDYEHSIFARAVDEPDAVNTSDVREVMSLIQEGVEVTWGTYVNLIENGDVEVVHCDENVIVLSTLDVSITENHLAPSSDFSFSQDTEVAADLLHRRIGKKVTDHNWGFSCPLCIANTEGIDIEEVNQ
jgi:hypothetical protein